MRITIFIVLVVCIRLVTFAQTEQKVLFFKKTRTEYIKAFALEKEIKNIEAREASKKEVYFRKIESEVIQEEPLLQNLQKDDEYINWYEPQITETDSLTLLKSAKVVYYSRQTGNWNSAATWSTTGCGGPSAASTPGSGVGDVAIICSGHTVTVNVNPANCLTRVEIKNGGTVICGTNQSRQFTICNTGIFIIEDEGTYNHNTTTTASTTVFNGNENFAPKSTIIISKWTNTTTNLITGVSSDFGNLTLNLTQALMSGNVLV